MAAEGRGGGVSASLAPGCCLLPPSSPQGRACPLPSMLDAPAAGGWGTGPTERPVHPTPALPGWVAGGLGRPSLPISRAPVQVEFLGQSPPVGTPATGWVQAGNDLLPNEEGDLEGTGAHQGWDPPFALQSQQLSESCVLGVRRGGGDRQALPWPRPTTTSCWGRCCFPGTPHLGQRCSSLPEASEPGPVSLIPRPARPPPGSLSSLCRAHRCPGLLPPPVSLSLVPAALREALPFPLGCLSDSY